MAQIRTMASYSSPQSATANAISYLWGGDPSLELWTDNPIMFQSNDIEILQDKDEITVTISNAGEYNISLCSIEDFGLSHFQEAKGVNSYTFNGVDVPCYINVNKHNYIPYTFNENVFIENKNYDRGSALVGKNITIEESSIAEGGSLSIKANEKVTLNGTFTCNIGGKLEIK